MENNKVLWLSIAVFALVGCSGSDEPSATSAKVASYEYEFGSKPSSVVGLRTKQVQVGDAARAWLLFQNSPEFESAVLNKKFRPSDAHQFEISSGGENAPAWWLKVRSDNSVSYYECEPWNKKFPSSHAVIAWDKDVNMIYFCHDVTL